MGRDSLAGGITWASMYSSASRCCLSFTALDTSRRSLARSMALWDTCCTFGRWRRSCQSRERNQEKHHKDTGRKHVHAVWWTHEEQTAVRGRPCRTLVQGRLCIRRVDHGSTDVSVRHNMREKAERQQGQGRQQTLASAAKKTSGERLPANIHHTELKSERAEGDQDENHGRHNVSVHIDRCLAWSKMS